MRWVSVLVCAVACTGARAPERALRCSLDEAVSITGAEKIACGNVASNARADEVPDCAERVREAARDHRSFVAIWDQPKYDGEVARHAVVGRSGDAGYELRFFEYSFVARCGPPGNCGDRSHEAWSARRCSELDEHLGCVGAAPSGECRD
jgi:hypothetical protein